jgi:hypothetical protein
MAGKAAILGGHARVSDYLSVGLLSRLVQPLLVDEGSNEGNKGADLFFGLHK